MDMSAKDNSVSTLIRKYFSAFLAHDRETLEAGLSDDFTFTSPRDDHISKAEFFERCFPGSTQFLTHHIDKLFVQDNEAFVLYQAELKNGTTFRNVEYYKIEGNKIKEVEVYFGSN